MADRVCQGCLATMMDQALALYCCGASHVGWRAFRNCRICSSCIAGIQAVVRPCSNAFKPERATCVGSAHERT